MMLLPLLCSLATNGTHALDPAETADTTPPSAPTIEYTSVVRRADRDDSGCGGTIASCGSYGVASFVVSATDDRATSIDQLGVRLAIAGGTLPAGMRLEDFDISLVYGGEVLLYFDYNAPAFELDLEVRVVDRNGNLGPPTIVHLADAPDDDDGGGCTVGGDASWLCVLGAIALAARRRRRG